MVQKKPVKQKRTTTQTFRFDSEVQRLLISEAENQRISLNVLVGHVLNDYAFYGRIFERYKVLRIGPSAFGWILQGISEDAIAHAASEAGRTHPAELLSALGRPITIDNLVQLVDEVFCRQANWFDYNSVQRENIWKVHLKHSLGHKWSVWLGEYFGSMFEEAGFRRIQPTTIHTQFVTLQFQPLLGTTTEKLRPIPNR